MQRNDKMQHVSLMLVSVLIFCFVQCSVIIVMALDLRWRHCVNISVLRIIHLVYLSRAYQIPHRTTVI